MNCKRMSDFNIYDVLDEYAPSDGIWCEDEHSINSLKKIVYRDLNETDRRIILSYAELGNVRDTARLFRVSSTTIWYRIADIRKRIKDKLGTNGIY